MSKPKLKPIAEQVILITGASSGIGLATARMAAARGARVMLVSRAAEVLPRLVAEIEASGGRAAFAVADVGDLAAVQMAARKTVDVFGRIDTWVNDAGVAIYAKLVDTPMDEHRQLFATNYFGAVHGALVAVEHLQREGGALITVGSVASTIPSPIMGAYAASKHAVKGYIDSLRVEIEADRLPIAVTLIKPAGIDTPIAQHAANHVDGEALIPPPVYDPDLVAQAILDAAQTPQREVSVGGTGRMQELAVQHFPKLLEWLGGAVARNLHDPSRPKTPLDSVARSASQGEERSSIKSGRRISVHAAVTRHPGVVSSVLAGVAVAAGLATLRRPRPKAKRRG